MLKALGIILVFLAFVFTGLFFSYKQLLVLKSLKRAELFLYNIILCLQNGHMTVEKILETAGENGDEISKNFVKNISLNKLSEAPKAAKICGFSVITTVYEILEEVFFVLGRYSAEEQIKEITFCREKLQNFYSKNEENIKNKAKLFAYCGFFGGIAAAIIMI